MDDLISRRKTIATLLEFVVEYLGGAFDEGLQLLLKEKLEQLPSAQPEQRWIPCSERLPEESGRYLISALDGIRRRTTVAPYQPRYKAWTMTGRMAYWKVVAWIPLPEPYRGEQE